MLFTDVIRHKRDGHELKQDEIEFFVQGLADQSIPPEQVSALAMAIYLNSMNFAETAALTAAMANSGTMLRWDAAALGGPIVDKHSTGGVGDKVSFLLAPIAAACGCYVPMISGRGLGHTGGTLDKIGSIPGYNALPDLDRLKRVVADVGCAIIGQTADLAPADGRFYAIRDITGTVESVPLVTASILSKKVAAGNDGLVMDIKFGTGAFMETMERARELARSIIGTGAQSGLAIHAVVTDMNEVLGLTAGNALEIAESMDYLTNRQRESRLDEVVMVLVAEMLVLTGLFADRDEARAAAETALSSGQAAEVFGRMVTALGGPADFVDHYQNHLPLAPVRVAVMSENEGFLTGVNTRAVGNAIIELGGGRRTLIDELDLSVGFSDITPIGAAVGKDRPLTQVHAATQATAERASQLYRDACTIGAQAPAARPVIYETLTR